MTVVIPIGKANPGEMLEVKVGTPWSSVAVGKVHETEAVARPESVFLLMFAGQLEITGGVLSVDTAMKNHFCSLI